MSTQEFICSDITKLESIAQLIINQYHNKKIFLFSGKMGAGKTTLIKEVCNVLDVVDIVNSPTFSIVNEYRTVNGDSIFHFDLYRIKNSDELLDIGYEEYLFSDSICLIEWPELAMNLMPADCVHITIEVEESTGARIIKTNITNR